MAGEVQQLLEQAVRKHQAGQAGAAGELYRRVLALDPRQPDALHLLGLARCQTGDYDEGIALLKQAIAQQPQVPGFHYNLGSALLEQRDYDGAEAAFRATLRLQPANIQALGNLAMLLESTNRPDQARETTDKALEIAPTDPLLNLVLAKIDRRDGQIEAGIGRLERLDPARLSTDQQQSLAAELGRLYDRADRPMEAFAQMSLANRMADRSSPVSAEERTRYRARLESLARCFTSDWVEGWRPCPPSAPSPAGRPAPIFLVGFPRSGTTLLEQMLDAHPQLRSLEESPAVEAIARGLEGWPGGYPAALADLGEPEREALRAAYFSVVDDRLTLAPGEQLIDKLPLNIAEAGTIHRVFPEARFILALRHPCDVCLSCFMQDFRLTAAMAFFLDLEETAALYDQVMALWHHYLALLPIRYHTLRYEDLLAAPEQELRALLAFLEADWDPAVLDHVGHARSKTKINTPSYHQVTEPLYQRSKYRWLHYRDALGPVLPLLMGWADRFGYEDLR